jgi:DNA-binding CsgD family transcriptional regulator
VGQSPAIDILPLTHRQSEVLHWMTEGQTNEEISSILGCSFFTVKNHLKVIFRRLGRHSRTHIAEAQVSRTLPRPNAPPIAKHR